MFRIVFCFSFDKRTWKSNKCEKDKEKAARMDRVIHLDNINAQ